MARTQSLEVLNRKIRELRAKAEYLEQAEKPGIKQLRALLKKYRLGPADVKTALNGSGRAGGSSKLKGQREGAENRGAWRMRSRHTKTERGC